MSDVRCNDIPVIAGSNIAIPRIGAWTADLIVDTDGAIDRAVTVSIGPAFQMKGSVLRQDVYNGAVRARIVGGAGGLGKLVRAKHYTRPALRVVLGDVLASAGESLALDSAEAALGTRLDHWTNVPIPAAKVIETLVSHGPDGTIWRVKPDGTIWLGTDSFPDAGLDDVRDMDRSGADGMVELGLDVPTLWPGVSINERKVDYVEHHIGGTNIRTFVWFQDENGQSAKERTRESMAANVRAAMPTPFYFGSYPAKLVKQSTDLSKVDVIPQVADLPPMANIPLRIGIPGTTVRVEAGAYLMIGWEGGDPAKPYAGLWNDGNGKIGALVTRVSIDAEAIELAGRGLNLLTDGFVHGTAIDSFTGVPMWQLGATSSVVLGRK